MNKIPILVLKLTGPLQSWGTNSRWNFRDTAPEPTKSGIIGLFACALGYKRTDMRIETELDKQLKVGVRVDQPGVITTDFHTVSGLHTIAMGKSKEHTELSYRSYLEDATFLVAVTGPLELLKKIKASLDRPKWPIYLGRKSCPPTRPVFEALTSDYISIKQALETISWKQVSPRDIPPKQLRCILEDEKGDILRKDAIRINPARIFGTRRITEFWITTPITELKVVR